MEAGVVPVFELLINNSAVQNLIRDNRSHEIGSVIETGMELGMIQMDRTIAEQVNLGNISPEMGERYAQNIDLYKRFINI